MDKVERSKHATRVTAIGGVVNALLTIGKIVVGILFGSMALLADGIHSLSDLISDVFIFISFLISRKPADKEHNYGHGRFETLGEVIVGVTLAIVAINMIRSGVEAIDGYKQGMINEPSMIVIIVAFISIVLKEWMYQYTNKWAKKLSSESMRANAIHHRTDAITSVAVVVALGFAKIFGSKWYILDPIVAIVVAAFIIGVSVNVLIKAFSILTDMSVSREDFEKIMTILENTPETTDPHNVRTRRLGSYIGIELHIRVNPDMKVKRAHEIASSIEQKLKEEFGQDTFVSVHIEPIKEKGEKDICVIKN